MYNYFILCTNVYTVVLKNKVYICLSCLAIEEKVTSTNPTIIRVVCTRGIFGTSSYSEGKKVGWIILNLVISKTFFFKKGFVNVVGGIMFLFDENDEWPSMW